MTFDRGAEALRGVASLVGEAPLRRVMATPGVHEAVRVTVRYHDARSPDSVATLTRGVGEAVGLRVVYTRFDDHGAPFDYDFRPESARFASVLAALRLNRFDTLDDDPDLPRYGADHWLIERAAGSFFHDVVLSPASARGHHREIVAALRQALPEALREIIN
ncbi:MAG: hypothetical protein ACLFTK_09885 [Anaerolineales bacterium]